MNVFTLMGKIAINNQDANSQIDDTSGRTGKLAQGLKSVGKVAGAAGKTIAAGMTAGAAAMGKMMQSSIAGYADYEQLVGGVETLFKDSSGKMLEYANNAYKTAGMSANDYMTTVTSFSASLLQSMGGDTAAATEVANMALTDMADNANKMGTSMDAIQNAYQGFAKQNYTMLDNLKLGYGGTQSEMKRLLKDAQKITGIKYDINNLNDVYEAIHVIQTEMGITGTTAAEASETISGSLGMAKAAWQNLLVGIADGNQDLGQLVSNFVDAGKTAAQNIIKVLPDLVAGVKGLVDGIMPEIPGIVQELFPALLEGAVSLVSGLVSVLPELLTTIGQTISDAWGANIWPAIQDFFKVQFGVDLPEWSVVEAEIKTLWNNISTGVVDLFKVVFSILKPDEDGGASTAKELIAWGKNLLEKLGNVYSTVFSIFTEDDDGRTVSERLKEWWNNVIAALGDYISAIFQIFMPDSDGKSVAQEILEWFAKVLDVIGTAICAVFGIKLPDPDSIISSIKDWWNEKIKPFLGLSTTATVKTTVTQARESGMSDQEINTGLASGEIIPNAKGAVFSRATIFDTRLGKQMVGEAGPEAVAPISVLQGYVADAVNNSNSTMVTLLAQILDAVQGQGSSMEEQMTRAFSTMRFDVNNREFARLVKAVT